MVCSDSSVTSSSIKLLSPPNAVIKLSSHDDEISNGVLTKVPLEKKSKRKSNVIKITKRKIRKAVSNKYLLSLLEKHRSKDRKIRELEKRKYLSSAEMVELKSLKLGKLKIKEQIASLA